MHGRLMRAATGIVTAGVLTAPGWAAQSALAAPRAATLVPCSASALSTAISTASSGGTLALAAGCRYQLTAPLPAITRNLTIRGNDATIAPSASASPAGFTLLTVGGPASSAADTVAITGLNVLNGAPGVFLASGAVSIKGGTFAGNTTAISTSYETTLSVTGATFTGNTGKYGGAIAAEWNAKLTNSIFTGNSAAQGGAVFVQGGKQTIAGCVFTGNTATYGGGGLYDDADVTMTGSTFTGNRATTGGAVTVFDPSSATLTVTGSAFTANRAQTGGALFNYDGLTVTGSTFIANRATQGGAIDQDWYATLTGDQFIQNSATASGGGLYAGFNTVLDDPTLDRNTAGSDGGAIYNGLGTLQFTGPLSVAGGSIDGNVAGGDGGGIFNDSADRATAVVSQTALLENQPDNCAPAQSVSGCAAAGGLGPPPGRGRGGPSRPGPLRYVPAHHGGRLTAAGAKVVAGLRLDQTGRPALHTAATGAPCLLPHASPALLCRVTTATSPL